MGKAKRTKVFAAVKRMISPYDNRKKENQKKSDELEKKKKEILQVAENPSSLFFKYLNILLFRYNMNLGPPFRIIVDTNFINFSIKNKLEMLSCMMNCLLAKCIPCITDCVLGELEKFGSKYRLALMLAKDPRFERLSCTHKGTYADDCIVNRVTEVILEMHHTSTDVISLQLVIKI